MKTKKILVIDEEETILATITKCLQKEEGFEVIPANNYVSAIEQLENNYPDLVITDMVKAQPGLPNIIDYLRQNPRTANLPLILLTGMDSENLMHVHSKVTAQIEKPFDMDIIVNKVKQLCVPAATKTV